MLYDAWNPGAVKVQYGGFDLSDGKGTDVYLRITKNSRRGDYEAGLDGHIAQKISLDNSAIITLTFVSVSKNAKAIRNVYQALREADKKGLVKGSAPLSITDPSNTVQFFGVEAALHHVGDEEFGAGIPSIDVELLVADLKAVSVDAATVTKLEPMLQAMGIAGAITANAGTQV